MNVYDVIIAIATIVFLFNVIPQIIRNFQFKNTLTQSITREILHQVGMCMIIYVYFKMNLFLSVFVSIIDMILRFLLIFQIIIWRNGKLL